MIRPTSWLPLTALALLVGLTLWLNQLVQAPDARADGSRRHDSRTLRRRRAATALPWGA